MQDTNVKSKFIICPICKENAKIKIKDFKISIFGCKKGHETNYITFDKYEDTQNIDISKIICGKCKEKNKSNTFNNEFFNCLTCKINICPLCKSFHDKIHNIINYENINFICPEHNEGYIKFCNMCGKHLCFSCEKDHSNHTIISLGNIIPKKIDLEKKLNELNDSINKFNKNIDEITKQIQKKNWKKFIILRKK